MTTTLLQILLLEDETMFREMLRDKIQSDFPPALIHEAGSYEKAIDILSTETIDYAYLDFTLKGEKTGLDVLQYIYENDLPTRSFILSSGTLSDGYLTHEQMEQCKAIGAVGYLSKKLSSINILRKTFDMVSQGFHCFPENGTRRRKKEDLPVKKTLADFGVKGRLCEVLYYIRNNQLTYKEIADRMEIEEVTVRQNYAQDLFRKFEVKNKNELIAKVLQLEIEIPKPTPKKLIK